MNSLRWGRGSSISSSMDEEPGEMEMFLGYTTGKSGWRDLRDRARCMEQSQAQASTAGCPVQAGRVLGLTQSP